MAIQFNDITAIGDVFEVHTNTPVLGIQSIVGYTDVVLSETGDRFFDREFRYSTNGVTYSSWLELTDEILIDTFVDERDIFDIQYRYTRAGIDATGILTFISIQLAGVVEEQSNPRIFTDLYFNKFFNYNDSSVLKWALNVLNKLYKRGIVANYVERGREGVNDDDYIAFFGALTHFMAILVRYAREFQDFTLNDILLGEYLGQKGVFVNDGMSLADLQTLLSNVYINFLERGTNEIVKKSGVDGRVIDGELLRLIRKGDQDEFIWGLIEPEKTIWNINNNSPTYKGTKQAVNLIKAYEFTEDVTVLVNYPLVESGYITKFTDGNKEVIRILNVDSPSGTILSGIGGAKNQGKLILIDSRLSYEVTFQVKQVILGDYFSLKINLYDKDEILLVDSPISAVSGAQTNVVIDTKSLLQNSEYYFVRLILFNENIGVDIKYVLDIGLGNHLIINNSLAKYVSIEVGVEITDGNAWDAVNELRIYDFKVRPLMTPISNSFVMVPNIITSFLENNSEQTNKVVENTIKRYLIPYNSILKNQFLDELYVPEGTPLTINVLFTDETILGADNGTITIVAIGGKAPYQYSIDNGVTFQGTGVFTGLSPATYDILVEDADGVQVTDTVVIAQGVVNLDFQAFVTLASRLDVADGQITVLVSGGISPYFYSKNGVDFVVSNIFTGLLAGNYTIYVRDTDLNEINKPVVVGAVRDKTVLISVVDELSADVVNVNVAVILENYLTNSSGDVVIYLENGSYNFVLTKSGYRTVNLTGIVISADRVIDVVIQTYYQIIFTVEDSGAVGIPDATISTVLTPNSQVSFTVQTDGSGVVTKTNIIAGYYMFVVTKDGFVDKSADLTIVGNDVITIVMDLVLYDLDVHVNGVPFSGSSYNLQSAGVLVDGISKVTNSSGNTSFVLLPDTYNVRVSKSNYETINEVVVLDADKSIVIDLRETVNIQVQLFAHLDPDPDYEEYQVSFLGPSNVTLFSDPNGSVTFPNMIVGTYTIEVLKLSVVVKTIYNQVIDVDMEIFIIV